MDASPSRGDQSSTSQGRPAAHSSTPQTHMQTQTRIFFPSSPRHTSSPPSPATSSSTTPRHATRRSTYSQQGRDYSSQPRTQTASQQGQDHYRSNGQRNASGSPSPHPLPPLFMLPARSCCECPIRSSLRANELPHFSHDNPSPPPLFWHLRSGLGRVYSLQAAAAQIVRQNEEEGRRGGGEGDVAMVGGFDARASPGVTVCCCSLRSRVPSFVYLCRAIYFYICLSLS